MLASVLASVRSLRRERTEAVAKKPGLLSAFGKAKQRKPVPIPEFERQHDLVKWLVQGEPLPQAIGASASPWSQRQPVWALFGDWHRSCVAILA